jgi:cytochrome c biogenesis protein CcmG/thiol:disulfide interchange protein DsbE
MLNRYVTVVAGVALVVVSLLASAPASAAVKGVKARDDAPDFSLTDADGKTVKLSNLKGKVVLLDFWATWCGGCKIEIPWYVEFQKKYHAKGLASIGVSLDEEGWGKVRPYLAEHPINYPIVVGDVDLAKKFFNVTAGLPVTLLIDRRGRIAESHQGLVDKDAFERDIRQLLQEKMK